MNMKIVSVLVGVTISIIMVGFVLTPVINDAVDDTKVYYNNDFGVLAAATDDPIEYSISYTGNTSGAISEVYINGVKSGTVYNGVRAIVISDSLVVSQQNSLNSWLISVGNSVESRTYNAMMSSPIELTITADNVSLSFKSDGSADISIEIPTNWCYYRDDNSKDYRIIDYTNSEKVIYVNDLKQVRGASWINTTGEFFNFEGTSVNVYGNTPENPTMVYEGYTNVMNGVYSFNLGAVISGNRTDGVHFDVDNNGTPYTVYPYFLVIPNMVYGQTESDISYSAILYAIPAIFISALIVAMLSSVIRRE